MLLNLLVLRARRPETLVRFYEALGLAFVREKHGSGPEHHSSSTDGAVFEIYPLQDDEGETTATRIGFAVHDLEQACVRAESRMGRIIRLPSETPLGRRAVLVDPEGHKVELLERRSTG